MSVPFLCSRLVSSVMSDLSDGELFVRCSPAGQDQPGLDCKYQIRIGGRVSHKLLMELIY